MPHGYTFEHLMSGLRQSREQPTEAWVETNHFGPNKFGVTFADGRRLPLGTIDPVRFRDQEHYQEGLRMAFLQCGYDISNLGQSQRAQSEQQAGQQYNWQEQSSINPEMFEEILRQFQAKMYGSAFFGSGRQSDMFRQPAPPPQPANPERAKALATCRNLKRLRDDKAAMPGEKANASTMLDRLMSKHSITEREL